MSERGLSKQVIEFSADLGAGAVQVAISERTGESWILKQLLAEVFEGDGKLEITLLPDLEAALEDAMASMDGALEAMVPVGAGPNVLGMDVSYAQGFAVNYDRAAEAGVKYCFIRASSGMTEKDPNFELNWMEAGRVGMLRGIYYYQYPEALATAGEIEDRSPEGQARRFARMLKDDAELGAVLDVEQNGLDPREVQRFVDEFQKHDPYGRPIMIYTGGWYWTALRGYTGEPVAWASEHPLWVAQYTSNALPVVPPADYQVAVPDPWEAFAIHQWTAVGGNLVDHVTRDLDLNHYPGTLEDLLAWSNVDEAPVAKTPVARKRVDAGGGLNVRAEPHVSGTKVATLKNGSEVEVFEEGEWDYVKAGDVVGYVFSQLLAA